MDPPAALDPKPEPGDNAASLNVLFAEFLSDDFVGSQGFGTEALDTATLDAAFQAARPGQWVAGGLVAPQQQQLQHAGSAKRPLEDNSLSDSDDDEDGGKPEKGSGKRAKGESLSAAATKKACREKARREKLNERFTELAKLIEPGNEPKTDKNAILTDAIKYVQQVQVENHQLRQLNKFLEERVSTLERERGQQLYQHSLMMQQHPSMMAAGQGMMGPGMVGGPAGVLPGMGMAQQMPQMGGGMGNGMGAGPMGLPSGGSLGGGMGSGILGTASAASAVPMRPGSTPPMQQQQMQQHQMQQQQQQQQQGSIQMQGGVQVQVAGLPQLPVQVQSGLGVVGPMGQGGGSYGTGAGAGAGPSKPQQMMMGAGSGGMMAGTGGPPYAGMYWVPPQMLDSTQDSLLRPPAA